jgi:hypothetical protein
LEIINPHQLNCVRIAIIAAGGPADTPDCVFTPLITGDPIAWFITKILDLEGSEAVVPVAKPTTA